MDVGTIFLHENFEFPDGTKKDKLLILVNSPKNTEDCLFCLTTSQEKRYKTREPGCHSKQDNYMLASNEDWFKKDTWIQFYKIHKLSTEEMLKRSLSDRFLQQKDRLKLKTIKPF